jgi:hypothetical protein
MTVRKFRFTTTKCLTGNEAPDEVWGVNHGYDFDTETKDLIMIFPGESPRDCTWMGITDLVLACVNDPDDDLNEVFD